MSAAESGKLVGIDLGTTFSAIATLDERGHAITLPNRDGEMLTPSAVLLDADLAVVGDAARDVGLEQPENVATLIKRRMGYTSYGRPIAGREVRPETLSAIILRKLVKDAEQRIGRVSRAVITVPAYFDDTRRKATKDAGRIAGLEVLDILDEPTAAALAYSFHAELTPAERSPGPAVTAKQTVLVYDLGGGTFDVTLVQLSQRRFEAIAIEGDVRLGGKDWDDRIIDFIADRFQQAYDEDPRSDPRSLANLAAAAERAKRTLSKLTHASITCTHAGKVLTVPLSRAEFEDLTRDLLTRTRFTTQMVLRQAGLAWAAVDRILLVGGSTHMPMTAKMMEELSGKKPDHSLAVSEVVARGAAIHAGILASRHAEANGLTLDADIRETFGQIEEINVNSHSLGVEVLHKHERVNNVLIHKNTQLPTAASRVYRTVTENQQRVRVKVLQGETHQADACINIGECWIDGLPAHLPKYSPIQVRCSCGSNGLIDVMALDMTSGKMARAEIHRTSGLSEEEIAREAQWVAKLNIQ